jgi:hypothetical protein
VERIIQGILAFLLGLTLSFALHATLARAYWKPEYAQLSPKMQKWFQGLRSDQSLVPCCDLADGKAPEDQDVEYDTKGDHYRVRIKGKWYDVPDDAVIKQPNLYGRTVVWYYFYNKNEIEGEEPTVIIRCFMPGGGV